METFLKRHKSWNFGWMEY